MQLRNRRTEVRLTEDEYARIKKQSATFGSIGHYIRSAIKEFSDTNARQRLDLMNELGNFYRAYRDDIFHISGNLNQSVKRANELAVAGLLSSSYLSQVLMPEIQNTQKVLDSFHQELIKATKKALKLR
ncbi:MAG: hypothetical protein K2N35_14865 [Muribaculaceae bacterium]|nr:hypothetical protein [Muribaculaceae bacterium]